MNSKIISLLFISLYFWICDIGHLFAGDRLSIDINQKMQRAQALYNQRETRENLQSAIEIYKNILECIPKLGKDYNKNRAGVLVELSKCYFKMAEYHAKDYHEKAMWFEMGEEVGREAMSLDPNNVGGYYWMAQNLGEHGSISKLYFLNKKSDFEEALKKAEELDNPHEPYDYSGIYRTLAAYHTPRFLWGDLDKALEYAQKVENSTRCLVNLSVLADLYWEVDKKKALEYAKRIVHADLSQFPETQFENSFVKKEVAEKWSKLLKQ